MPTLREIEEAVAKKRRAVFDAMESVRGSPGVREALAFEALQDACGCGGFHCPFHARRYWELSN